MLERRPPASIFDPSRCRRGLDWLLAANPHLELLSAEWQRGDPEHGEMHGPWLLVTLGQASADGSDAFALYPFAIWKATGAVHGMAGGEVIDPPIHDP